VYIFEYGFHGSDYVCRRAQTLIQDLLGKGLKSPVSPVYGYVHVVVCVSHCRPAGGGWASRYQSRLSAADNMDRGEVMPGLSGSLKCRPVCCVGSVHSCLGAHMIVYTPIPWVPILPTPSITVRACTDKMEGMNERKPISQGYV
jgi:hypothetical protein